MSNEKYKSEFEYGNGMVPHLNVDYSLLQSLPIHPAIGVGLIDHYNIMNEAMGNQGHRDREQTYKAHDFAHHLFGLLKCLGIADGRRITEELIHNYGYRNWEESAREGLEFKWYIDPTRTFPNLVIFPNFRSIINLPEGVSHEDLPNPNDYLKFVEPEDYQYELDKVKHLLSLDPDLLYSVYSLMDAFVDELRSQIRSYLQNKNKIYLPIPKQIIFILSRFLTHDQFRKLLETRLLLDFEKQSRRAVTRQDLYSDENFFHEVILPALDELEHRADLKDHFDITQRHAARIWFHIYNLSIEGIAGYLKRDETEIRKWVLEI